MRPALVISDGVVAGNAYDKYGTRNPVARRLMRGFEAGLERLLARAGSPTSVLEAGCGEGHVTSRLAARFPRARVRGTDASPEIIAIARERHPDGEFAVESIYGVDGADGAWDLVVACEVLEHLEDPARGLAELARVARSHVLVSVPREPLWRALNIARGYQLRAWGNTPGHLQHWSRGAFLAFVARQLDIVAVESPLPWTQVLARPRRSATR